MQKHQLTIFQGSQLRISGYAVASPSSMPFLKLLLARLYAAFSALRIRRKPSPNCRQFLSAQTQTKDR